MIYINFNQINNNSIYAIDEDTTKYKAFVSFLLSEGWLDYY